MSLTKTVVCFPRQTTLGTPNSMPDGVEDQFNWIGSPNTLPVLDREAIEGELCLTIFLAEDGGLGGDFGSYVLIIDRVLPVHRPRLVSARFRRQIGLSQKRNRSAIEYRELYNAPMRIDP